MSSVIYVDDIIVLSRNSEEIEITETGLGKRFEMKDLRRPTRCLEIDLRQDGESISIVQGTCAHEIVNRFAIIECKLLSTLLGADMRLIRNDLWSELDESKLPYQEMLEGIFYFSVTTRSALIHLPGVLS